ncbi:hypothetical protein KAR52_02455 [Candidatus Pacearchaeota archaeon]|nr:hypothetical protein [Candidatus Pacearchaeota archaeon]
MEREFTRNKRGLSLIVSILMVVLLVFVAIGIVWFVVRNVLEEGSGGISLRGFSVDLEINNAFVEEGNIHVNVERNPGKGNLVGIKFIFYDETESEGIEINTSLSELEKKSFDFTLVILDTSEVNKVAIAPIYESNSGERVLGDIMDTYTIGAGTGEPDPETCTPDVDPCGSWVCGNVMNGTCGEISCGPCSGTCVEGVCEGCTPDCTGKECGDDGCGGSCGPCDGTCTDGVCEGCTPDCTGKECGSDGCGENENCGACAGTCVDGICIIETSVNNGTVGDTWPPGVGVVMYFDSEDLPKVDVDYTHYYISFSGSETGCLLIADFVTPDFPEIYNKTHIRFNFPSEIQTGDTYHIWETQEGCLAA